jgi:hypothetical protein
MVRMLNRRTFLKTSTASLPLAAAIQTLRDPHKLRSYYGDLFGWIFDTSARVSRLNSCRAQIISLRPPCPRTIR